MSTSNRFFINPSQPLGKVDAREELLASLERITTHNPPVHTCSTGWTFQGFYSGPTSIAYLFYRLSQIYPGLEFKQQSLLDWAEAYLALGARLKKRAPDPSHCGIANETLAHLALTALMQRDMGLVKQICSFEAALNSDSEEGSNEWLYGRAGYLYVMRMCRKLVNIEDSTSSTANVLDNAIKKTVDRILAASQPWTWHGKEYLGAVHGTIGIVCQLVLSLPSAAPRLQNLLSDLLDQQCASGNFPSSAGSGSNKLVQFCHGGPGFIVSLRSLAPHFPELRPKIEAAIQNAVADIWKRGLLTKRPCLCHGIAGNALALGGDEKWFMHFLLFMTTESMERAGWMRDAGRSDEFVGLYTGEAGRAWTWAMAETNGPRVYIGYNDL
ncbi:hypothetical protein F4677DRAFT_134815 [Hypoxylon crocopeplum]|nr:hypothetical protein F4677DRAFT_134815 [Hypoxylon crocopeplum]